jgi:hypothetical protein
MASRTPIVRKLSVFVASPSDTSAERNCLAGVVDELNHGLALDHDYVLELVKWETHAWPARGVDVQDVINRQINTPDIFILILWKRIGTPSGRAKSGTIEEFERAYDAAKAGQNIDFLTYFKRTPYYPEAEDIDQIRQVLEFRGRIQNLGMLTWDFVDTSEFRDNVRKHLTQVVRTRSEPRTFDSGHVAKPSRAQECYKRLLSGTLETRVDVHDAEAVSDLMGITGAALQTRGFHQERIFAVQTALWEC